MSRLVLEVKFTRQTEVSLKAGLYFFYIANLAAFDDGLGSLRRGVETVKVQLISYDTVIRVYISIYR